MTKFPFPTAQRTQFKRHRQSCFYMDKPETVKGYIAYSKCAQENIFMCKADSIDSQRPWYSFKEDGTLIRDRQDYSRENAFFHAEMKLLFDKTPEDKQADLLPF